MFLSACSFALLALSLRVIAAQICTPGQTELHFMHRNLGVFPDLTDCSSTLKVLDISFNAILSIPSSISSLTALEELDVGGNSIHSLPDEIGTLSNLRVLRVNENNLDSLPDSFGGLHNLRLFELFHNNFYQFPAVILSLWGLEVLGMHHNHISEVPVELGNLFNLQSVNFGGNQLFSIPAELGKLRNLNTLLVYDNYVTCLPRSVKRLPGFFNGNHLRVCTNNTATGYVMHRSRNYHHCNGPVRNTSGIAVGCNDYVRSSCVQTEDTVTVTKDYLSDLSSAGLSCDDSAPVLSSTVDVYPRCDPDTGMATTCVDPKGADAPYPHRKAGMTTIKFSSFEECYEDYENLLLTRRRLTQDTPVVTADASAQASAPAAKSDVAEDATAQGELEVFDTEGAIKATPNPEKFRLHPDLPAFKAAARARAKQMEEEDRKRFSSVRTTLDNACAANGPDGIVLVYPRTYDFTGCENDVTTLTIQGGMNMSHFAEELPKLTNLQMLSFWWTYEELPDNLDVLPHLTHLTIAYPYHHELPEVIHRMSALTHFTYSGWLDYLPWWFDEMTQLKFLDFTNAGLYSWYSAFEKLVNLEHLLLRNTWIHGNPAAGLGRLTKLRTLDLRDNYIFRLPVSVGELKQLEHLLLEGTQIQCLPEAIRTLPSLQNSSTPHIYATCPEIALPVAFSQVRNNGCLWNDYYGFWYREICDARVDKLTVILYADSACRKQAKRKVVHSLNARFPNLGYCMPSSSWVFNGTATMTHSITYCHN